jgi:hypothetical protein
MTDDRGNDWLASREWREDDDERRAEGKARDRELREEADADD